jgi:hypothetical protein
MIDWDGAFGIVIDKEGPEDLWILTEYHPESLRGMIAGNTPIRDFLEQGPIAVVHYPSGDHIIVDPSEFYGKNPDCRMDPFIGVRVERFNAALQEAAEDYKVANLAVEGKYWEEPDIVEYLSDSSIKVDRRVAFIDILHDRVTGGEPFSEEEIFGTERVLQVFMDLIPQTRCRASWMKLLYMIRHYGNEEMWEAAKAGVDAETLAWYARAHGEV